MTEVIITNHFLPLLFPITSSEIFILLIIVSQQCMLQTEELVFIFILKALFTFCLGSLQGQMVNLSLSTHCSGGQASSFFFFLMTYCCLLITCTGSKVKGIASRNRPKQSLALIQRSHMLGHHGGS